MTLLVQLPCPHHYRHLGFPRVPTAGRCWRSDCPENRTWRSDYAPWLSDCPRNRDWQSDRHPRWSDYPPLCRLIVGRLIDIRRAPCDTDDSAHASRGPDVRDSTCASHSSGIPALLTSHPRATWESPVGPLLQQS
jgi:hypothetical protein